jgi:hypothetical protein
MTTRVTHYCANCEATARENEALQAKLEHLEHLAWSALDGVYGGDAFETLPIETMTADRKAALNELLDYLGILAEEKRNMAQDGEQ